jgi:hypothetical protein
MRPAASAAPAASARRLSIHPRLTTKLVDRQRAAGLTFS